MSTPPPNRRNGLAYDPDTVDRVGRAAFFRTLVENSSDGILTIDEHSTIVAANPALGDIFGYAPDELVGASLLELVPPDLRERHEESIRRYLETGERGLDWDDVELPGLHADGHRVDLAISFREHVEGDRHLFTAIIRDVTREKERERRLERYDTIVDTVGDAVYQLDREGRFVEVNDVVTEVTGYTREELLGEPASKVLDAEGVAASLAVIQELIEDDGKDVGLVELDVHTADGDVIPAEDRIALLRSDDELRGTVGVVRDISDRKEAEAERRLLHTTIRSAATARTFVDGLADVIEDVCEGTVWDYGEAWIPSDDGVRLERTSAASAVSDALEPFNEVSRATSFGPGEGLPGCVWSRAEPEWVSDVSSASAAAFPRVTAATDVGLGAALGVPICHEGDVVAVLAFYMVEPCERDDRLVEVISSVATELGGLMDRKRKADEIRAHERELERQRDELAELERINTVIRDVNRTLVDASTYGEIERAVCDRLADSESYAFAWIGEVHPSRGVVEPRVSAGVTDEELHERLVDVEANGTGPGRTVATSRSTAVQVTRDLAADLDGEHRAEAVERGYRASAAVPLVYRGCLYGVLHLYTDRLHAFSDREVAVLEELGEAIGLAMDAVESRKLLHADTAIELTFRVDDSDSFLTEASRRLGCTIELEGVVPKAENCYLYYVTVEGADASAFVAAAEAEPDVRGVAVVDEYDGGGLLLVQVAGSSATLALIEAGARIRSAVAEAGESTIVVHVAPDADVGRVVDTVRRAFPRSALRGKREIERPVQTKREFREAVKGRLTDKQRNALEAAYHGGYFGRPRTITGSELAETFGVARSTFHHHIQAGLDKVLDAVFDESRAG